MQRLRAFGRSASLLVLLSCSPLHGQTGSAPSLSSLFDPIDKMSLPAVMGMIQEALNTQGKLTFQAVGVFTPAPPSKPVRMASETSFTISDAVADPARCTLSLHSVDESRDDTGARATSESSIVLAMRDVETLEIQSVLEGYRTGTERNTSWDVFPPTFILHVLLNPGKTYQDHTRFTDDRGVVTESDSEMRGGFWLYFGEEPIARRMAEAMERASSLCAGKK